MGLGDIEILDVNNQCAHMNYTNRVANGLGLLHEAVADERSLDRVPASGAVASRAVSPARR